MYFTNFYNIILLNFIFFTKIMKKIFSLIILSLLIFFWNILNTFSYSISIWWNNNVITWEWEKSPYCPNPWDCSLERWINEVKWKIDWIETNLTAAAYIQQIILYVLWFFALVTIIIIIWAWVMILMSAWNDDRVETAKKIIINCVIWLVVIFLAYPITNFIISIFDNSR